ncbi:hypothetical protein C8Q79DRAFT_990719 [Trametes meyenii]|nr:hypothetical protein C8Q79DRAFT_990719 [Trametes meyenii]
MSFSSSPGPAVNSVPLKDWERADKVNLEVLSYGWNGKRVIVRMHLPMDRDMQRLHAATRNLIRCVKHSAHWRCEFCGRHSRETQVQTATWVRIDPPRMIIYIHHICDHDNPSCFQDMEDVHNAMQRLDGRPEDPLPRPPPKPEGMVCPRAGSCAGCQEDLPFKTQLKRCAGCQLTRYCSVKCQREDWPRHKDTCKKIHSVVFEDGRDD